MLRLLVVELYRTIVLQIRYPVEFVSGMILLTCLFYGLLIGAQHITGAESFNANLNGIIIGYAVWMILYGGMNFIPGTIQGEAQRGTLEAIFLSYLSIIKIFIARALTSSLVTVLFTSIILVVLLWMTDRHVSFSFAIILPVLATVIAAIGLGFMLGGLALEFKQIGQILVLMQYPLLFLMMTPFETMDSLILQYSLFLPVVPSAITLRELMVDNHSIWDTYYLASLLNGICYLLLGVGVFNILVKKVKRKGLLAGY